MLKKNFPENIFPENNTEAGLLILNKIQNILTLDLIPVLNIQEEGSKIGSLGAACWPWPQITGVSEVASSFDICPFFAFFKILLEHESNVILGTKISKIFLY